MQPSGPKPEVPIHKAILLGLSVILVFATGTMAYAQPGNSVGRESGIFRPLLANVAPTVTVGVDQAITIADRAFLHGVVTDDKQPHEITSPTWSKISGPGTVTFGNEHDFLTWATFSATGTYVLRLAVNDGQLGSSDDLSVVVNAGYPHTIRVPQDYGTIQAAINASQNGDLVLVSPGSYVENLSFGKTITLASTFYTTGDASKIEQTVVSSPNIANPVILVGSTAGPATRLVGFTIQNGDDGLKIHGNISIFNSRFLTHAADAIDYAAGSAGLVMDNYYQSNDDDCVDIDDAEVLIEHNQMVSNGEGVEIRLGNRTGAQLTIIMRGNYITTSRKTGFQVIDTDSIVPTAALIIIERNVVVHNPQSALSLMDQKITTDDYRAASLLERIHLFNNTFVGNNYGAHGGDNLIALNNIIMDHPGIGVKQIDGASLLSHNLLWSNGTDNLGSNLDLPTTLFVDPKLDASYELQSGSPAIDAGTAVFTLPSGETVLDIPTGDYSGSAPDLGAYESIFGSAPTSTPSPSATSTRTPTPTPTIPSGSTPTPAATNTPSQSDLIFASGFESGSFSGWSSTQADAGDLAVNAGAAMIGIRGLRARIDGIGPIFVTDDRPKAEPRYRARFYFNPYSIAMADGDSHNIFVGYQGAGTAVMQVQFRYYSGKYQLRAVVRDDVTGWRYTGWFPISNTAHFIEIHWRAATAPGANNGGITLWIDGVAKANLKTLDNDTRRIDRVRLGALGGIDPGTHGTYFFDAFVSRRRTLIGP